MTESFCVKSVEGIDRWFREHGQHEYIFPGICSSNGITHRFPSYGRDWKPVELIHHFYDEKIGWVGTHWYKNMPIEFKYANIKIGDVIDYYTTSDGVLKIPQWASFKFAVDEYLAEAPAFKFHPSRVRAFIEENGVDRLELME